MESFTKFIIDSTDGLERSLAEKVKDLFVEVYAEFELDPTNQKLNKAATELHELFHSSLQKKEETTVKMPTLQDLMDQLQLCAHKEIMEMYGTDSFLGEFGDFDEQYNGMSDFKNTELFDSSGEYEEFEDEIFLSPENIPDEYRVPIIQQLQSCLTVRPCCDPHIMPACSYLQILDLVNGNRSVWDKEMLDFVYEFVLTQLRCMNFNMAPHRREIGLPTIN